ncbi:MAG: hypothetical protein GYA40_07380 [Chloroflexi bacterium]|nr:hypothetical protein [Chloroflexota bacterium]
MYPREYFDTFWRNDIKEEVFVAMPFHDEFVAVWEKAIKPGIEENGKYHLKANRVDVTTLSGSILSSIFDGIAHSKIFLADISTTDTGKWAGQRNGNVMYEVGLAHALRHSSEVILLKSDSAPINFDIMSILIHNYDKNNLEQAKQEIGEKVIATINNVEITKTLNVEKAVASINPPAMTYLINYGKYVGFSLRKPANMGDELVAIKEYLAIQLLIEKKIIEYEPKSSNKNQAFYKWTFFGFAILQRLNLS